MRRNNEKIHKFYGKVEFPTRIRKGLILGLKAEKQLQTKNHTEDWVLCNHPCGVMVS